MRTGILGGTFDPVHLGHVAIACAALSELKLDRLLLIPSGEPPYKKPIASRADRLHMTRLAAEDIDGAEACDIEIMREGSTYALDTLRALRTDNPDDELIYILGSDAAARTTRWHGAEEISALCRFACVLRKGSETDAPGGMLTLNADIPDISSADVRRRVSGGLSTDGLLPAKVAEHIADTGLYIAGMSEEDIIADLRGRLKPGRLRHTLGVVETAVELAVIFGAHVGRARCAALLHDCAKGLSPEELLRLADASGADADEIECLPVLHAPVGAYLARERYGVRDQAVLSAIRGHTVGAERMSLLDAIVYVADMVEPGRDEFPGLADARALARRDIFRAAALCGRLTREYNEKRGGTLHPMTEKMINNIETGGMNNG